MTQILNSKGEVAIYQAKQEQIDVRRRFSGAQFTRLTSDWHTSQTTLDTDIHAGNRTLTDRARDLEQNSEFGEGYLKMIERNVVGADGFTLQMKIFDDNGTHDRQAETAIEAEWKRFSKGANFSLCQTVSRFEAEILTARAIVRDGGNITRIHRKPSRKYGIALETLDIDLLDENYNAVMRDGSRIIMSIEIDRDGRPIAYHLLGNHPGDWYWTTGGQKRTRVLARDIIHPYLRKRSSQHRGYSEFSSIMPKLRQLDKYQESTLVNARASADKMGFLQRKSEMDLGAGADPGEYAETQAGMIEILPLGYEFNAYDPKQPTTGYKEFTNDYKRGFATGLGVSYINLANDPGDANFSSARIGVVEEREGYKMLQRVMIEKYCEPIFEAWLFNALTMRKIATPDGNALPVSKYDKYNNPVIRGRRWQWLDPRADSEAARNDLEMGIVSHAQVAAERGGDEEDTLDEVEQTLEQRSSLGLVDKERLEAIKEYKAQQAQKQETTEQPMINALGAAGLQALNTFIATMHTSGNTPEANALMLMRVFGFSEQDAKKLTEKTLDTQEQTD